MSDSSNNSLKTQSEKRDIVNSPCISICALDENDICIGCFRSGKEITDWGRVDNDGKRAILKNVAQRMAEH